jgi:hypothetical protein
MERKKAFYLGGLGKEGSVEKLITPSQIEKAQDLAGE